MSYDINLKDATTGMVSKVKNFIMFGGTVPVKEERGMLFQTEQSDARVNITYNYAKYFYAVTEGDERFAQTRDCSGDVKYGIRGIYGKTGAESIPLLNIMIERLNTRYKDENGSWFEGEGMTTDYWEPTAANAIRSLQQMIMLAKQCPDSIWEGD